MRKLKHFEGVEAGGSRPARDVVNQAMIRHWCDAMGDANPNYTDPEFAAASPHGGIVAPPTMLQAWTMPGYRIRRSEAVSARQSKVMELLDEAGFTSVVATNCEQEYRRYLRLGERVSVAVGIDRISEEKKTALGTGHFIDQLYTFTADDGEVVGTMRFRLLKFRPPARTPSAASEKPRVRRPRPAANQDNAFFWDGIKRGKLLIQRCTGCQRLRHPPGPMCPKCSSLEWDTLEASGRGSVYSYVVAHHPPVPSVEVFHKPPD